MHTTRKITNPGITMLSLNLDTSDAKGNRQSLILAPRQVIEVSDEQFQSRELQKLKGSGYIVDMTAAEDRRKQREVQKGTFPGF